jgi:hypothetical protein
MPPGWIVVWIGGRFVVGWALARQVQIPSAPPGPDLFDRVLLCCVWSWSWAMKSPE